MVGSDGRHALAQAYRRLNAGHGRRLVFQLTNRGFGSELNNMLLGLLYGLWTGQTFQLSSRTWNARYQSGWTDWFEPFCTECPAKLLETGSVWDDLRRHLDGDFRSRCRWRVRQVLVRALYPGTSLTYQRWPEFRSPRFAAQRFFIPSLGIDGDIFAALQVLARMLWRLRPQVKSRIHAQVRAALPEAYVGVHIRRGDKLSSREAERVEVRSYLARMDSLGTGLDTVFVASDDHNAVAEFRLAAPHWRVVSFCQPTLRGHRQASFNSQRPEQRQLATEHILRDLEALIRAEYFIGTFSSNLGRLLCLLRGQRQCTSMDCAWYPR